MKSLGNVTLGPNDSHKDLGPISLAEGQDTLWLNVAQLQPTENWKYSYAIVSFVSTAGAELGSTKVYGNQLGEVFQLGVRRAPSIRSGVIRFRPRAYNLQWFSAKGAPKWTLSVAYETGKVQSGTGDTVATAVNGVFRDLAHAGVRWLVRQGTAYVLLTPGK